MTAEQARTIAQESEQIMDKISIAAFDGKIEIHVPYLSDVVYEGLKSLGYTISCEGSFGSNSFYTIKW